METTVSRCWNYIGLEICIDAMWLTLPRWTNCSKPSISYPLLQVGKVRWPDIIRSLVLASLSEYRAIDSVTDQAYDIRVGEMLEERWQPIECFHPAMTLSNDLQESDLKGANAVDMKDFSLFSGCFDKFQDDFSLFQLSHWSAQFEILTNFDSLEVKITKLLRNTLHTHISLTKVNNGLLLYFLESRWKTPLSSILELQYTTRYFQVWWKPFVQSYCSLRTKMNSLP